MTYLYIDESGDLGFGKNASEYFIISCIKIDDEKTNTKFHRISKKIRQRKLSKKLKTTAELKFSNSSEIVRCSFFKNVSKLDIEIYSLIIKKEHTKYNLRNNLPILYNYLIKILLEKPLRKIDKNCALEIYLDKCMSKYQRNNFENYIKTEFLSIFKDIPELTIYHEASDSNCGIQVTDFICGAFGYKYNTKKLKGDYDKYLKIIKDRIALERDDLFKKN